MGRPTPTILLSEFKNASKEVRILQADTYYYVVYKGKPFNPLEIDRNPARTYNRKQYVTNGWAHKGHADRLAKRLNKLFKTEDFTVKQI